MPIIRTGFRRVLFSMAPVLQRRIFDGQDLMADHSTAPIVQLPVVADGGLTVPAKRGAFQALHPAGAGSRDRPDDVRLLRQAFQSLGEGILVVDRVGEPMIVNPAACALLERTEAQLLAADWLGGLDPRTEAGTLLSGEASLGTRRWRAGTRSTASRSASRSATGHVRGCRSATSR